MKFELAGRSALFDIDQPQLRLWPIGRLKQIRFF